MRLLNVHSLQLESFIGNRVPDYAILSHTWGDEEVTFEELGTPEAAAKQGFDKITRTCARAAADGYSYVWIDTCCIDKRSSAELSEAINSMFRWYQEAQICYAHLEDSVGLSGIPRRCRWFRRGWTLQELLAPPRLVFIDRNWAVCGSREDAAGNISAVTNISERALRGPDTRAYINSTSIARRMSWAAGRETTREEDVAYCLMGLFGVNMPLLYGEGGNAFLRLQEEIMKQSNDQTLLAWSRAPRFKRYSYRGPEEPMGPLALHPSDFAQSGDFVHIGNRFEVKSQYSITNQGVRIRMPIVLRSTESPDEYWGLLPCVKQGSFSQHYLLKLRAVQRSGEAFVREGALLKGRPVDDSLVKRAKPRDICIVRGTEDLNMLSYLWVRANSQPGFAFGLVGTHGTWDSSSNSVALVSSPRTCPDRRCYVVRFVWGAGCFVAVITFLPRKKYTATLQLIACSLHEPPENFLHLDDPQNPSRTGRCRNGDRVISVSLAWHFILGHEVLVLDVGDAKPRNLSRLSLAAGALAAGLVGALRSIPHGVRSTLWSAMFMGYIHTGKLVRCVAYNLLSRLLVSLAVPADASSEFWTEWTVVGTQLTPLCQLRRCWMLAAVLRFFYYGFFLTQVLVAGIFLVSALPKTRDWSSHRGYTLAFVLMISIAVTAVVADAKTRSDGNSGRALFFVLSAWLSLHLVVFISSHRRSRRVSIWDVWELPSILAQNNLE